MWCWSYPRPAGAECLSIMITFVPFQSRRYWECLLYPCATLHTHAILMGMLLMVFSRYPHDIAHPCTTLSEHYCNAVLAPGRRALSMCVALGRSLVVAIAQGFAHHLLRREHHTSPHFLLWQLPRASHIIDYGQSTTSTPTLGVFDVRYFTSPRVW